MMAELRVARAIAGLVTPRLSWLIQQGFDCTHACWSRSARRCAGYLSGGSFPRSREDPIPRTTPILVLRRVLSLASSRRDSPSPCVPQLEPRLVTLDVVSEAGGLCPDALLSALTCVSTARPAASFPMLTLLCGWVEELRRSALPFSFFASRTRPTTL